MKTETKKSESLFAGDMANALPAWRGEVCEIFAVWPSGKLLSRKAGKLRENINLFLKENLS